MANFFPK